MPGMAAKGIFQPKLQISAMHMGPALKNHRLRTHMGDLLHPLCLLDMDPQQLPALIQHLHTQGMDLPFRAAH